MSAAEGGATRFSRAFCAPWGTICRVRAVMVYLYRLSIGILRLPGVRAASGRRHGSSHTLTMGRPTDARRGQFNDSHALRMPTPTHRTGRALLSYAKVTLETSAGVHS